jgi:predicted Zn-dependent protease with MMP-like domain
MVSIARMQEMLDDIASELPQELFTDLNGGIVLLPEAKRHEKGGDIYILGEYHRGGLMGRYISIYYRSFMNVYGHLDEDELKKELRNTVRHEFRHHIESLAGADDLERIDEEDIARMTEGDDEDDDEDDD